MAGADDSSLDLDRFFDLSPDHLVVSGFDGYFKRLSRSWVTTFGWSLEELYARPNIEFVHLDDRAKTLAARNELVNDIPLEHLVNRYLCKDGAFRWMEWKSVGHPENERVYCVARDITDQVTAQQAKESAQAQLIIAERMASIGRLAGGVGHEINNPLAYIMANLGVVREDLHGLRASGAAVSPELDQCLGEALQGAQRIKAIVEGLQTFSRPDEMRATIELRPVLELSLSMVANELRPRARLAESYGATPAVNADSARLAQVFISILTNALQAMASGDARTNELRVSTSTDGRRRAVVEFQDNGVGIAKGTLPRVFEPFFTTRPPGQGAGLGLWFCHSIVSALNGEVSIDSQPGRGTTVRVALPGASTG